LKLDKQLEKTFHV